LRNISVRIAGLEYRFEPWTYRIRRRSVNHSATTFGLKKLEKKETMKREFEADTDVKFTNPYL
jgi:hypothetical protein